MLGFAQPVEAGALLLRRVGSQSPLGRRAKELLLCLGSDHKRLPPCGVRGLLELRTLI